MTYAAARLFSDDAPPPPQAGLVVEDDNDARPWLADCLREAFGGIPVTQTADVASAKRWLADWLEAESPRRLVAVVDLGLPDGSGIEIVRLLASRGDAAAAVVATIYDDDEHLFAAIAAGAAGYLLKDRSAPVMVDYLRRIQAGEPPLSPSLSRRILAHFRDGGPAPGSVSVAPAAAPCAPTSPVSSPISALSDSLTPREREVLALLGRGLRSAEAAAVLKLSEHTVASHIKAIYGKLNISSRAEAALEARNLGLA